MSSVPKPQLGLPWPKYEQIFECIEIGEKNCKVKCKLCAPITKILSTSLVASSNLKKHVLSIHPDKAQLLDRKTIEMRKRTGELIDGPNKKQLKIVEVGQAVVPVSQGELDELILNLVVEGVLPFSLCDKSTRLGAAFSKLIKRVQPKRDVICSKTLKLRLCEIWDKTREDIIGKMQNVEHISVTADCWTAAKRGYIAVTAHWICPSTFKREHAALACQRLKGRHTYDVLAAAMDRIFSNYQIQNKLTAATTDSGSNFVKAFRMFGEEQAEEQQKLSVPEDDVEFVELYDILDNMSSTDDDRSVAEPVLPLLPHHYRCASHTLNLVANKDAGKALITMGLKAISRVTFAKCKGVWNKQNNSTIAADLVKDAFGFYLRTPNDTRWNSLFDACSQLKTLLSTNCSLDKMNNICDALTLPRFKKVEITFLKEYVDAMQPIATALDILQGQDNMFMGYLLPTLYQIIIDLEELLRKMKPVYCGPLISELIKSIKQRFEPVWWSRPLVLASISHPRFKLRWIPKEHKTEAYRWLLGEVEVLQKDRSQTEQLSPTSPLNNGDVADTFFKFPADPDYNETFIENAAETIVSKYLKNKETNLAIFGIREYDLLKSIFLKYNTTLPSSAPVERVFSVAAGVFGDKRHALTDKNFETQLLLNLNADFIDFKHICK